MRRILLTLAILCGSIASMSAGDSYSRNVNDLPPAAKSALATNFKSKVSLIKIDKDFGRVSDYEVILNDGSEITFDRAGNWENIEVAPAKAVPAKFILAPIANYIKANHKGAKIIGIDKDRRGYEVQLSNGLELKFNREGKFLRYDD